VAIGDGCLAADEYNRPRDLAGLPLTKVEPGGSEDLAPRLRVGLKLDWPVQVALVNAKPPTPFVGFRWARDGRRWLVNVCNYSRQPVQVRVSCSGARRLRNLFTAQPVTGAVALQPMEPALIEAR